MSLHLATVPSAPKKSGLRRPDSGAIRETARLLEGLQRHPKVTIVDRVDVYQHAMGCHNEDGVLKKVIVSPPTWLDWDVPINAAEEINPKPDRGLAVQQWGGLIEALLQHGVEVVVIRPSVGRLEGVYTRDIGFVADGKFIQGNMVAPPRVPEEDTVLGGIKPPQEVKLEGGNVILEDDNLLLLGIGRRTNWAAAEWLRSQVDREIVPIELQPDVLHLDCALGPGRKAGGKQPGGALVYESAYVHEKDVALLRKIYGRLFNMDGNEYMQLGANTLALDPETRIVVAGSPGAQQVLAQELKLKVMALDVSELVLAEGAGRCATLPLLRG